MFGRRTWRTCGHWQNGDLQGSGQGSGQEMCCLQLLRWIGLQSAGQVLQGEWVSEVSEWWSTGSLDTVLENCDALSAATLLIDGPLCWSTTLIKQRTCPRQPTNERTARAAMMTFSTDTQIQRQQQRYRYRYRYISVARVQTQWSHQRRRPSIWMSLP